MDKTLEQHDNHFEINITKDFTANDALGQFSVNLPPMTLSKDNITKRCVMTLKECIIYDTDNHYANDILMARSGAFILSIVGMGIKNSVINCTGDELTLIGNNTAEFLFTNQTQADMVINDDVVEFCDNQTGNYNINEQRLCSNPFGNTLTIRMMFADGRGPLHFRADQILVVKMCVDFIDPKVDQNFI